MLDNLFFGGEVENFMEKRDEMINKLEETKSMLSSDEKEPVVVMGNVAEVEDINNEV